MFSAYSNRINIGTKLANCETAIGHSFRSKGIGAQALIARGYVDLPAPLVHKGTPIDCEDTNEFLAIHGEAVATSYLSLKWLKKGLNRDQWNTILQSALSNRNLAQIGRRHGLEKCLVTNPDVEIGIVTIALSVKAIIGAVHYDAGEEAATQVIGTLGLTHDLLDSGNDASAS